MINIDLYLSQYLFQFGRDLPQLLVVFLAIGLTWVLFVFVLYRASRLAARQDKIMFLARAALAAALGLGLNALIAYFYFRTRPFAAEGFAALISKSALEKSFPSDHATVAWAVATVIFLYNKKSGYWAIIAAALIGLGRVLAGVHYVGDVVAGAGLGILVAWLVFKISANAAGSTRDGR